MQIRRFKPGEEMELWRLFHDAVRHINTPDYTPEQLHAWSPDHIDFDKWCAAFRYTSPFVVEYEAKLIAFADVQPNGYVDHFYVHHLWQRRRVGTLLMQIMLEVARQDAIDNLFADVNLTARPFFESWGFAVEREQYLQIHEVMLKNYRMAKPLGQRNNRSALGRPM